MDTLVEEKHAPVSRPVHGPLSVCVGTFSWSPLAFPTHMRHTLAIHILRLLLLKKNCQVHLFSSSIAKTKALDGIINRAYASVLSVRSLSLYFVLV